ncbi:MAG: maltose/maltodextrin transport system substrate-binding protein [Puniceicoccaceae bacterium 5H]|nr:MAG: maltose/maltodextrin transport system substrate-binding protein [Puniceicoccaceae bacterium 5H]
MIPLFSARKIAGLTLLIGALLPRLHAAQEGELRVWIGADKGVRGLEEVAARFTKETGVAVTIETPQNLPQAFAEQAEGEHAPDIVFWQQDHVSRWAEDGLIEPVETDDAYRQRFYAPGWEAMSHDGEVWGYPLTLENVSLIYNKELVEQPPQTLEQVIELSHQLREEEAVDALLWDYANPYFTWGILASDGAYAFAPTEGGYNTEQSGVHSAGAIAALETLVLMVDQKVLPANSSYSVLEAKMNAGECAMMINGPWSWANLRSSGIDFGVAPLPGVNGHTGKPFVTVVGGMVTHASPNQEAAQRFLRDFVLTDEGLESIDDDVPLVVPALKSFADKLATENPHIQGSLENALQGQVMPNVPEMTRFWANMGFAISNAVRGHLSPDDALKLAEDRIENR